MTDPDELNAMTPEETRAIEALQGRGFAVIIFNPSELRQASSTTVEERLVEFGNAAIEMLNDLYESNKDLT